MTGEDLLLGIRVKGYTVLIQFAFKGESMLAENIQLEMLFFVDVQIQFLVLISPNS